MMTKTIEAIYENNVFRPVKPVEGLKEHQHIELTLRIPPARIGLSDLAGTLTSKEAEEIRNIIDKEFERIDGEW